jgi:hypothetical protein
MPFIYTSVALSNLERSIARDRLASYLADAKGDLLIAITLYERNTLFSQGLYGALQPLEITLRNSVHRTMVAGLGRTDWYDHAKLRFREAESVKEAKNNIVKWNNAVTPGRVVAELTFGFWTKLLSREYEKSLWVPHLHRAFPYLKRPDRTAVSFRFDAIKLLRNKIAHHEKIISRPLDKDYANIIEAIEWICPTTAAWIRSTNTFQRDYS